MTSCDHFTDNPGAKHVRIRLAKVCSFLAQWGYEIRQRRATLRMVYSPSEIRSEESSRADAHRHV